MSYKIYISLLFFININLLLFCQDTIGLPLIKNYNYQEYHAHFQTWDATQTKEGLMLFANGDGLLTFDGKNWVLHKLPNETFPRTVAVSDNGKIYLAGDNFFGQMIVNEKGKLEYKSLNKLIPEEYRNSFTIWKLIITNNTIYGLGITEIFKITNTGSSVIKSDNSFYNLFYIKGKLFAPQTKGYKLINNNKATSIDSSSIIVNFFQRNDSIFYLTTANDIFYVDKKLNKHLFSHINFDFSGYRINNFISYQNNYLLFYTYNKGILQFDIKGNLITKLNKNTGIISNTIYSVIPDNSGNIWLCTNDGLSYVELNSPLRIIDSRFKIDVSTIMSISKFNKQLYINSGYHFYRFNFNNKNISPVEINQVSGQTWNGIEIGDELYLSHNRRIIRLDKSGKVKQYGPDVNVWKILQIPGNFDKFFVGTNNGIYLYKYNGDSLKFVKKLKRIEDNIREMLFDSLGNFWVSSSSKGIYKIQLNDKFEIYKYKLYDKNKGLQYLSSIILFNWQNHLLISVYKTLYEYDYMKDTIHVFHTLTDNYDFSGKKILQLVNIDKNDNFWIEYYDENFNFNVFVLKYINGKFKESCPISRRIMNFSLSNSIVFNDNYNILTTNKGLVFINMKKCSDTSSINFQTLIRKVSYLKKDSTVFEGYSYDFSPEIISTFQQKDKELSIDFKNNDIQFIFSAPFYTEPNKILYRYKLLNFDTEWSNWTLDTKKDYTNLSPGKYIFVVEAKNIYNQISKRAYFNLHVKYPWYRTFYAYLVYSIFLILIIIGIVKYFTYSLKRKNEKLEKIVDERTSELIQKNVELEQQTEEITTQAEELQIVNQELEKFSIAVRETDNAIILADKDGNFIWINSAFTKIFGYTFDELVNEVSKNLISDKTDIYVKEVINKCLTEKVTVEYELNLKNKFNKNIWVHTTLTPVLDENNNIATLVAIDSDVTKLKNAEVQIREQRDQIKASITYAKTIQESILPANSYISKLFENFIIYKAKDIVSGDFYWISNVFEKKTNGQLTRIYGDNITFEPGYTVFFVVVDCTGHGVPGAFMSLIGNHLLGEIINEEKHDDPKQILQILDNKLSDVLKRSKTKNYDGMVLSICKLDKLLINGNEKVKVTFSGAKQHITYYKNELKKFHKIRGAARQIGFVINENIEFVNHEFFLNKGDFLFLYSDGLKDLNNKNRDSFGYKRIINTLSHYLTKDVSEIKKNLEIKMKEWSEDEYQRDDITFIGLKIK